jgi:putative membrane-bound dehydrogenase-like protein
MNRRVSIAIVSIGLIAGLGFEIPKPDDAPQPLSPAESVAKVKLPAGFRLELVAAEPLINEPSGVCWDERGRLFVSELHGYNLEGQYDIEELNKTGKLDHEVRRLDADERIKQRARAEMHGTVKLLADTDGDGRMDKAEVWANDLPPVYGVCAARGGVIAVCAPDIVYLADRDGDGKPEIRETLFTGFAVGNLERGINAPQWGPDDWIYVGKGHDGGRITGPHLAQPVDLPKTDFRIKPDGTAIEPITGATSTIGMAFTTDGERFAIFTGSPGLHVGPLSWRYLARNPFVAAPKLVNNAMLDQRCYPISKAHPWRTKRSEDPGFAKYYTDRYGIAESAPNGYYTSACSPLVYDDDAMPGLRGQLFACEPAQNFVSRSMVVRDGSMLKLVRPKGEERSEFLASADPWFHPINLSTGPDGAIWISDYYREIIEDYSAIPRYLQQQYGLINGHDRGRIWRLAHDNMPKEPPHDMSRLSNRQLADEIGSKYQWRRQTARRLLVEHGARDVGPQLSKLAASAKDASMAIHALSTLDALGLVKPDDVIAALGSSDAGIRVAGLRLAEPRFDGDDRVWRAINQCKASEPHVRLQLALTLGDSKRPQSLATLANLAREHGDELWMPVAIQSGLLGRTGQMFHELARSPESIGKASGMIAPLCTTIAARRDADELSSAIVEIAAMNNSSLQTTCLRGLRAGFRSPQSVASSDEARSALKKLAGSGKGDAKKQALGLIAVMRLESDAERKERLAQATSLLADSTADSDAQISAVLELSAESNADIVSSLIEALGASTPRVREAILAELIGRSENLPLVLDAIEGKRLPPTAFSAVQRRSLLDARDRRVRARATNLFESVSGPNPEEFARFMKALAAERDLDAGAKVFRDKCATCHLAHDLGFAVGPDLTAEFGRAEEAYIRDILAPSETISAGYTTYNLITIDGRILNGLLAAETPTSITMREAGGKDQVILRKDIDELRALPTSLMIDNLSKELSPADVANVIAWLRQPTSRRVLVDENLDLVSHLNQGDGAAEFESKDVLNGKVSLRITPPQRFSAKIAGWSFPIREKPGPGEYRYLRFAWKTDGGDGVLLELADKGKWPRPDQPTRRYFAGKNTTGWHATRVSSSAPSKWTEQTRDLWADFGDFTLTGIAPTAIGGPALFDRVELLQEAPRE